MFIVYLQHFQSELTASPISLNLALTSYDFGKIVSKHL